jgi:hypothetical protein
LGDVEVEGAHPQQFLFGVEPGAGDLDPLAGGVDDRARLGAQILLPLLGDLRGEAQ